MKVLFLALNISENTLKGGDLATKSNFDALVDIYGRDNIAILRIPEEKKIWRKYIYYALYKSMFSRHDAQELIQRINSIEWELIFFDGSWFGRISDQIVRKGKILTFFHNAEYQYSLQRLKRNPLTLCKYMSVIYNEKCLVKNTDYIITLNTRDKHLIEEQYQKKVDLILPIALSDKYADDNNGEIKRYEKTLLFVGSYFNPNKEGVKWFIKHVMPHTDYNLIIAGKGMERLKRYENDKVSVLGTVDNLSGLYQAVDIVVMPIFSGGGMKVKMAEAMMYGKRILATKEALTGYDVIEMDAVTECNTKEEFIDALNRIKDNGENFYPEVREKFLEKYEQSVKTKELAEFFHCNGM